MAPLRKTRYVRYDCGLDFDVLLTIITPRNPILCIRKKYSTAYIDIHNKEIRQYVFLSRFFSSSVIHRHASGISSFIYTPKKNHSVNNE